MDVKFVLTDSLLVPMVDGKSGIIVYLDDIACDVDDNLVDVTWREAYERDLIRLGDDDFPYVETDN